jgi:hypothetical protein
VPTRNPVTWPPLASTLATSAAFCSGVHRRRRSITTSQPLLLEIPEGQSFPQRDRFDHKPQDGSGRTLTHPLFRALRRRTSEAARTRRRRAPLPCLLRSSAASIGAPGLAATREPIMAENVADRHAGLHRLGYTGSFSSVEKRRRRATPLIASIFENVSDVGVCPGLSLGPPAIARVRSKRGALQSTRTACCSARSRTTAPAPRQGARMPGSTKLVRGYSAELGFLIGVHALRATAATNALDHQGRHRQGPGVARPPPTPASTTAARPDPRIARPLKSPINHGNVGRNRNPQPFIDDDVLSCSGSGAFRVPDPMIVVAIA